MKKYLILFIYRSVFIMVGRSFHTNTENLSGSMFCTLSQSSFCNTIFMFHIQFFKWEKNEKTSDTFINSGYTYIIESKLRTCKSKYKADRKHRKTNNYFSKELGRNADFYKPVLNKIMMIHEYVWKK